jgi:hypothetical protein
MLFLVLNDEEVHPNYDVGVWINSPFFASALGQIFEGTWDKMTPLNKLKI